MFAPKVTKTPTKAAKSPVGELTQQCSALAARPFGGGAVSPENMPVQEAPRGVSWDFSRIPVSSPDSASPNLRYTAPVRRPAGDRTADPALVGGLDLKHSLPLTRSHPHLAAKPIQNAMFEVDDEPLAVFDEDGNELEELPTQETEGPEQPSTQEANTNSRIGGDAGAAATSAPSVMTAASPAALAQPVKHHPTVTGPKTKHPPTVTSPKAKHLTITGPREMWFFGGEAPPSYKVSAQLGSSESTGKFSWSTSAHLQLSSASAAKPTIKTIDRSKALKDAKVFLTHTDAAGVTAKASYSLTVRSPYSMTPTGNTNNPIPRGWQTLIGYSIQDQFKKTLPRSVPINEQWINKPPIPDFAGTNWPTYPPVEGNATVNPAGWQDNVNIADGIPPILVPTPMAPGGGGPLVQHFAGHWHVGRLAPPGGGVSVRNVTWRFFQDHGAHV